MIDKRIEPYYDMMISIFLGVILVLAINMLYDSPRSVVVFSDTKHEIHKNGCSGVNYQHNTQMLDSH